MLTYEVILKRPYTVSDQQTMTVEATSAEQAEQIARQALINNINDEDDFWQSDYPQGGVYGDITATVTIEADYEDIIETE